MSDDALRVIRKLLSRAEATDFESERDTCLAKVAELMARHSLEEALLWSDAESDRTAPEERTLVVPSPYASRKVLLFAAVGQHTGCTVIDLGNDVDAVRRVAVVGFPGDLDRVELLTTSLLVQLTRSMLAGSPSARRRSSAAPGSASAGATSAWRRSFISGFTGRVVERLTAARAHEAGTTRAQHGGRSDREGSRSVALVLADRSDAVDAEVRRRYPYLRTRHVDAGSSRHGHAAGREAGNRAGLGETQLGGRRSLPA